MVVKHSRRTLALEKVVADKLGAAQQRGCCRFFRGTTRRGALAAAAMAESDRRRQLDLWRSRRGGGKAGEAPAGGAAAGAASSAAGKRRAGEAEAGPTPTKLVFGSENESRSGNVAAGTAPQCGAGRGGVKRAAEDAPSGVRAVSPAAADKGRVSVAGIRERLAQSAKKRKVHLEERLAASAAKQSAERAAVDAVPAQELALLASDRTALRRQSLEQMVRAQVDVAEQLCASGNVRSAREALRELHADVGEATEVGEFWACLAGLELRAGNTLRAAGALVHALRSAGGAHAQVRALAAELIQKQLLQGVVTLHPLGELLAEPFAAAGEREAGAGARAGAASQAAGAAAAQAASPDVFEEEDDLGKYLKFNPNTTAKKRPQSALKSGVGRAVRVPVTFIEGDDEPSASAPQAQASSSSSSSAQSCAVAPAAASKAAAAAVAAAAAAKDAALGLGSVTTVAAVKTTGKARETLGSSVSLTPVRRSGRLSKTPGKGEDRLALLKETGHTYVPNNQLLEED